MKNPIAGERRIRHALLVLALFLLCAAAFWSVKWVHYRMTHVISDDARVDGEVTTLSSRVSGWISQFPVIEGDAIRLDQLVAKIDDRDTRLKRDALAAQLESNRLQQQAQEAEIRQTDTSTRGDLSNAQGKVDSALANRQSLQNKLDLARAEYRRSEDLSVKHFISPQALDQSRTNLALAEAELRKSDADIAAMRGAYASAQGGRDKLAVLDAKLKASHSDADQIRAQIAALDAEIADRVIKSPLNGTVVMTFVREKEFVSAGQRLMMVHNPQKQWIQANIKETDIADVKIGASVEIRASAYPDQLFHGKVIRVGGAATSKFALLPDPNPSGNFTKITQRLPIRIALDQAAPELHPGMMVEVAIEHGSR